MLFGFRGPTQRKGSPVAFFLTPPLAKIPGAGRLFTCLTVNTITKQFAVMRRAAEVPGARGVLHSLQRWFVTQGECAAVLGHAF